MKDFERSFGEPRPRRIQSLAGWLGRWRRQLAIAASLAILVFAVGSGGVALSTRPGFCLNCHEIEAAYSQWRTSTHYGVGCTDCHTQPGPLGLAQITWNGISHSVQHVTNNYEYPISHAPVEDNSCLRCHIKSERPESIPQASLRVMHTRHSQQSCANCHSRLVHIGPGQEVALGKPLPHAERDCTVCHRPDNCPHGSAKVDCVSCHQLQVTNHELARKRGVMGRDSCIECHVSQKVSSAENCQVCHFSPHGVDTACTRCHTSTTTWTQRSFEHPFKLVGQHDQLQCNRCHTNGKFTGLEYVCKNCHQRPHLGFGSDGCAACHTPISWKGSVNQLFSQFGIALGAPPRIIHGLDGHENCVACHGSGRARPYPPDHKNTANDTCVGCHKTGAEEPTPTPTPVVTAVKPPSQPAGAGTAVKLPSQPAGAGTAVKPPSQPVAATPSGPPPSFAKDVLPILQKSCALCHGESGGWSAADYKNVTTSGKHPPAVKPGDPDGSVLIQKQAGSHKNSPQQLNPQDLEKIRA